MQYHWYSCRPDDMAHYTLLNPFIADADWQKFLTALAVGGVMVAAGSLLARKISTPKGIDDAVIPATKISTFGVADFAVDQWVRFQDSILGKEHREYAPFTAAVFFFVLFANLIGLVPGFPAATTTVWVNVGLAFVVFFYFNFIGIKAHGLLGYLKHFMGPVSQLHWSLYWLVLLIFPLEIFSTFLRLLTLNLRLYWNISADHIVLGVFTELVPFGIPIIFYALGTFVAFMQAFIFSLLTMVYIQLASHEETEEH